MIDPAIKLTLFVVGDSHNSRTARESLRGLLDSNPDSERIQLEVVDILEHPSRAAKEGILITPTLKVNNNGKTRVFIGNLSRPEDLSFALNPDSDNLATASSED